MKITTDSPKIYVACLAAYNQGILHGAWIEARQEVEDIEAEISAMLAASPIKGAEEWEIHDSQGFHGIYAHIDLAKVSKIAQALSEANDPKLLAELHEFLDNIDIDETVEFFQDNYIGLYKDLGYFAADWCEQCGTEIPKFFANYIDYDAMGRDMELSGDIITIQDCHEIHVFMNI